MTSVLMILTGAKIWTMKNGLAHPTGYWAHEFIRPHQLFIEAGFEVSIATPNGVTPTVDPLSLSLGYNNNDAADVAGQEAYIQNLSDVLSSTLILEDVQPNYDVVFIVGGHGPMQDLAVHPTIGTLLAATLDNPKKILSSVCHGPASFISAHKADGSWLFTGRKLTGFSNEEENQATFAGNAPWLLEDRLRLSGAHYISEPAWSAHVVEDGNLITGQNQVSAEAAALAILKKLKS